MSEKDPNGMPGPGADGTNTGDQDADANGGAKVDTVKYDSYRKVVSANKAKDAKLREMSDRLAELEQGNLATEGKKDELISSLKEQVNDYKGKYQTAVGTFAKGKGFDAVLDEAVKAGCSSTGLLRKVVADRIAELDFDDEFNPDREQVKMIVEDIRREEPILFSKKAPNIPGHNPGPSNGPIEKKQKAVADMSPEEQEALVRQIDKAEGKTLGW